MSDRLNKERVEPKQNQQTEEEIKSYWTSDQKKKSVPIPIPSVAPPKEVKEKPKHQPPGTNEVIMEPSEPDAK